LYVLLLDLRLPTTLILFPYTTLFRSCAGCSGRTSFADIYWKEFGPRVGFAYAHSSKLVVRGGYGINYSPPLQDGFDFPYTEGFRSEEHTSELQSRFDLVCRLLLEKKK